MTAPQPRINGRPGLNLPVEAEKPTQRREGHQAIRVPSARQLSQTAHSKISDEPQGEHKR